MSEKYHPPKLFQSFFRRICSPDLREELEGDLEEMFRKNIASAGLRSARNAYRKEVIRMFRPSVAGKIKIGTNTRAAGDLLYNYSKVAFRNIRRNRLFSFFNITGLALSMSVGMLIIAMILELLSYDQFHINKDRIYRVTSSTVFSNNFTDEKATAPLPLAKRLKEDYNCCEEVVRVQRYFGGDVAIGTKILPLHGYFVDPNFFSVFSFELLSGNQTRVLEDPYSLVITQQAALRLFGNLDVVGRTVSVAKLGEFTITGLVKEPPLHSHLQFEMLASFNTVSLLERQSKLASTLDQWDEFNSNYIYLQLPKGEEKARIQTILDQVAAKEYRAIQNVDATFKLQALTSILPGRDLSNAIGPKMIYLPLIILSILVLAVLLSACFNYTNLSFARAIRRSKEVGVRKVVGGTRKQVFYQFLTESVIIALLSLGFAWVAFLHLRPEFLAIIPKATKMLSLQISWPIAAAFVVFALFTGLLAGYLPARLFSGMTPLSMLNQEGSLGKWKKTNMRKALLVFQFALSLLFIMVVTIINKQYQFSINHDFGFDQENIINVDLQGNDPQLVANEFSRLSDVSEISFSSYIPGTGSTWSSWVKKEGLPDSTIAFHLSVDHKYINNIGIDIISGGNFPKGHEQQHQGLIIVNEQFVKTFQLGSPLEALGQVVVAANKAVEIQGVVRDFHYSSLEDPIKAFYFEYQPETFAHANLKISTTDIQATMLAMEDAWEKADPFRPFKARFFDEQLEETYNFYTNIVKLFGFMGLLAIVIACFGLLGMALYTVETQAKSISIRKVFGASEWQLVIWLTRGFVKMLLIAGLLALPLAYLLLEKVLLNLSAYHIDPGIADYGLGILIVFSVALLIVGSQTVRVARLNPAVTLRKE